MANDRSAKKAQSDERKAKIYERRERVNAVRQAGQVPAESSNDSESRRSARKSSGKKR